MKRMIAIVALVEVLLPIILPIPVDALDDRKDDKKIVIGIVNNFSNYLSPCGDPRGVNFLRSIGMAYEDFIRKNPAFNGRILLKKFDYGSSVVSTEKITLDVVNSDVVAVVGYPCSSFALLGAPILEKNGVPTIMPSATMDSLTEGRKYIFRSCFSDSDQARAMAEFLYCDELKRDAVIIVNSDHPYSVNLANKFNDAFINKGGRVQAIYNTLSSQKSYMDTISKLNSNKYDVIFIPNHERESSVLAKELTEQGIFTTLAGGDGWGNLYGYIFPKYAESDRIDAYAIAHWDVDSKSKYSMDYVDKYYTRYNEQPNDNSALAYDAANILFHAILNAKKWDRDGICNAISSIQTYYGVTGVYSFDGTDGTPRKTIYIVKFKGDKASMNVSGGRAFSIHKNVAY